MIIIKFTNTEQAWALEGGIVIVESDLSKGVCYFCIVLVDIKKKKKHKKSRFRFRYSFYSTSPNTGTCIIDATYNLEKK